MKFKMKKGINSFLKRKRICQQIAKRRKKITMDDKKLPFEETKLNKNLKMAFLWKGTISAIFVLGNLRLTRKKASGFGNER